MTLIYAERLKDLVFLMADTYWEQTLLGRNKDWRSEPLTKIVNVGNGVTVAFAGNSDLARSAISNVLKSNCTDAQSILLAAHLESNGTVDFILVDHKLFQLFRISEGVSIEVQTCHLSSHEGFSKFQGLRIATENAGPPDMTYLSIVKSPEKISTESAEKYASSLKKFQQTLLRETNPHSDWGGFVVPFYLTKQGFTYGSYLENFRSQLAEEEVSPVGSSAIPHNDLVTGGYQIGFTGSTKGFAAHFVNGGFGFIYTGFENQKLEPKKYTLTNPYDFALAAENIGCASFGTWRSAVNDTVQLYNYVAEGNVQGIAYLLKFREEELLARINSSGNVADFSAGVLAALNIAGELVTGIETLHLITFVLQARSELAKLSSDTEVWKRAVREVAIWQQTIAAIKFSMSFNFPSELP